MWLIIIPLFGGYFFSLWKPKLVARLPVAGLTTLSMTLLLMVMGARLGADPQVVSQIVSLGVQAAIMAVATVVGSTLLLCAVQYLLPRQVKLAQGAGTETGGASGHRLTLILVTSVLAGSILGLLIIPQSLLPLLNALTTWILGLLLLAVGLDLGASSKAFAQLKDCGFKIILVPLAVILGSILGGLAVSMFWRGAVWNEMAAVASGFGWYSLSSVLIAEVHSPLLGAVAFLANIFRELIAIIVTPLVARWLGPIPSLGAAGATAMDVLLPVVAKGVGREYVPLAFFSGAVLSLSVALFVRVFLLF